jgi:hypothetical protein
MIQQILKSTDQHVLLGVDIGRQRVHGILNLLHFSCLPGQIVEAFMFQVHQFQRRTGVEPLRRRASSGASASTAAKAGRLILGWILGSGLALTGPGATAAQGVPPDSGSAVRLWARDLGYHGQPVVLSALTADSLAIVSWPGPVRWLPLRNVEHMEVFGGRESRWAAARDGGVIGALVGAGVGALMAVATWDSVRTAGGDPVTVAAALTVVSTGLGLISGAAIGAARPGERWVPVALPDPSFEPLADAALQAVVPAGSWVRVPLYGGGIEGRIVGLDHEALELELGGDVIRIPRSAVRLIQVPTGRESRLTSGARAAPYGLLLGGTLGLLTGAILEAVAGHRFEDEGEAFVTGFFSTATSCTMLVFVAGALSPEWRWRNVPLPAPRVGLEIVPQAGAVGVVVRHRF